MSGLTGCTRRWRHYRSGVIGAWSFPKLTVPPRLTCRNAARLLTSDYAANRLYLIYHRELSLDDAERVFGLWRRYCPADVEIVPTLVLRTYDKQQGEVFTVDQLRRLAAFFKRDVNPERIGVYDVHAKRDQGAGLTVLTKEFPRGVVRVGIQPDEPLAPPFVAAVEDTWSAFCHGKTNDGWRQPGFGAATLRQWIEHRNGSQQPVSWNLIVVAWDYSVTERGGYPGYDDANKNMPLPARRNALAAKEILRCAKRDRLAGLSSDLFILHVNSRSPAHDGPRGGFYETLKRGEVYRGYYAESFHEVIAIFAGLKRARAPKQP